MYRNVYNMVSYEGLEEGLQGPQVKIVRLQDDQRNGRASNPKPTHVDLYYLAELDDEIERLKEIYADAAHKTKAQRKIIKGDIETLLYAREKLLDEAPEDAPHVRKNVGTTRFNPAKAGAVARRNARMLAQRL